MLATQTLLVFFAASAALAIAPGPDNLFVLTQSALHGRRAGWLVTLGLCSGLIVHTSAVALGVAAVFQTSALAFDLLKWVGAAYLVWLAWGAWRAGASALPEGERTPLGARALYLRGIVMNVTNPKVAIFFLAFLPQFADPSRGPVAGQILVLGGVFMLAALLVFGTIAWAAGHIGGWLRGSPRAQVVMNRIAAGVFVALAGRLALSSR